MKFPKKLIAFGLSLCMSVVPCGPVAAEDFTDAQTDMTDAIDTFTCLLYTSDAADEL